MQAASTVGVRAEPACCPVRRHAIPRPSPARTTHPGIRLTKDKAAMRIVDVREITQPIASPIRNAYIDFSKMTTSLVAVVTDVVRDGRPVVGYGFNSNGR
jgi:hypothetical protein